MGESKELAKSNLKTNRVAPMEREEPKPIEPAPATEPLSTRNPTLPLTGGEGSETPDPCSPNVSPLQENQEGEAVVVEEGTMVDLKKTEELNPKFLETASNQGFEETKEEDELTSTPKTDRTTTLRTPDPTDDPRSDHHRSDGRVVGPWTALYRPYGRNGTMRLTSDCSTGQRPQRFHPDNRHVSPGPHGQAPCVRPDPCRPHGQPVGLRQSSSRPPDRDTNHDQPQVPTVSPRTAPAQRPGYVDDPRNQSLPVCRPRERYTNPQPPDLSHDPNVDPCAYHQLNNLQPPDRTIYSPPDIEWKTNWQEVMGIDTKGRCKAIGLIKPRGMEKEDGESSYSQVCTISTTTNDSFSQESEEERTRTIPDGCEEWSEEEIDAYYAEHAIKIDLGDYSREDATFDDSLTDENDDREPREAYSCMAAQIPLDNSAEDDDVQRFRKKAEAIEPGSFRPRRPQTPHRKPCIGEKPIRRAQSRYSLPPYGDKSGEISAKIEQLERQIRRKVAMREVIEMRVNDLEEILLDELVRVMRSHKLLKEIDSTLKEKYRELDKKLEDISHHVAGHDDGIEVDGARTYDDDINEDKGNLPISRNVARSRHKSHPLRVPERGKTYGKEGDPPYEGMDKDLVGINKGRPKETGQETSSPSA